MRSVHYRILRSYKDTPHGPSDRIRTCGILLPNNLEKLFPVISNGFWLFPLGFTYSLDLFEPAFSGCSGAVCGHLCGQKRFPPQTGDFFTGPGREAFRVSDWLDCNSEGRIMQVFSAMSTAQDLRGNRQRKITFRSRPGWPSRQTPPFPHRRPCRCSYGSGHRPHTFHPDLPGSPACRCRNGR